MKKTLFVLALAVALTGCTTEDQAPAVKPTPTASATVTGTPTTSAPGTPTLQPPTLDLPPTATAAPAATTPATTAPAPPKVTDAPDVVLGEREQAFMLRLQGIDRELSSDEGWAVTGAHRICDAKAAGANSVELRNYAMDQFSRNGQPPSAQTADAIVDAARRELCS